MSVIFATVTGVGRGLDADLTEPAGDQLRRLHAIAVVGRHVEPPLQVVAAHRVVAHPVTVGVDVAGVLEHLVRGLEVERVRLGRLPVPGDGGRHHHRGAGLPVAAEDTLDQLVAIDRHRHRIAHGRILEVLGTGAGGVRRRTRLLHEALVEAQMRVRERTHRRSSRCPARSRASRTDPRGYLRRSRSSPCFRAWTIVSSFAKNW